MRRLPPSNESEPKKTVMALIAPKAIGLALGLVLGHLLFQALASEPAAAPALPVAASTR